MNTNSVGPANNAAHNAALAALPANNQPAPAANQPAAQPPAQPVPAAPAQVVAQGAREISHPTKLADNAKAKPILARIAQAIPEICANIVLLGLPAAMKAANRQRIEPYTLNLPGTNKSVEVDSHIGPKKLPHGVTHAQMQQQLQAKVDAGHRIWDQVGKGVLTGGCTTEQASDLMFYLQVTAEDKCGHCFKDGAFNVPDPDGKLKRFLDSANSSKALRGSDAAGASTGAHRLTMPAGKGVSKILPHNNSVAFYGTLPKGGNIGMTEDRLYISLRPGPKYRPADRHSFRPGGGLAKEDKALVKACLAKLPDGLRREMVKNGVFSTGGVRAFLANADRIAADASSAGPVKQDIANLAHYFRARYPDADTRVGKEVVLQASDLPGGARRVRINDQPDVRQIPARQNVANNPPAPAPAPANAALEAEADPLLADPSANLAAPVTSNAAAPNSLDDASVDELDQLMDELLADEAVKQPVNSHAAAPNSLDDASVDELDQLMDELLADEAAKQPVSSDAAAPNSLDDASVDELDQLMDELLADEAVNPSPNSGVDSGSADPLGDELDKLLDDLIATHPKRDTSALGDLPEVESGPDMLDDLLAYDSSVPAESSSVVADTNRILDDMVADLEKDPRAGLESPAPEGDFNEMLDRLQAGGDARPARPLASVDAPPPADGSLEELEALLAELTADEAEAPSPPAWGDLPPLADVDDIVGTSSSQGYVEGSLEALLAELEADGAAATIPSESPLLGLARDLGMDLTPDEERLLNQHS